MALSTISVLLTQAWIAGCFRFEGNVSAVNGHEDLALAGSASPTASTSLQPVLDKTSALDSPESTVAESKAASADCSAAKVAASAEGRNNVANIDYPAVRKQVEYYLSDENLHHDKFFHDLISADSDRWLEMRFILTCNRIKGLGVTSEDEIVAALKESEVEVRKDGAGVSVRRPGNAPLPKWEPRIHYQELSSVHAYDGGVIAVFNNVSSDVSSAVIQAALRSALPLEAKLLFVSDVDEQQRCFFSTAPFFGDVAFFESLTIVALGVKLKPQLCKGEALLVALKLLPKHIRERREREGRKRQEERTRPLNTNGAFQAMGYGKDNTNFRSYGKFDPAKVPERVENVLYERVALATKAVEQLNASLAPGEVARRIVKYMYNSAKRQELHEMDFEHACDEFVKFAMGSYEMSFGAKEWFFQLDLAPAFAAAAWELLRGQNDLRFGQVKAKTRAAFEEYLDAAMLNRAILEASRNTFPDAVIHKRVNAVVQKTHRLAFDATIKEVRPEQELERVEYFLKHWINDSMTRAWNSVPDAENVLTVSNVSRLFQNMLFPFGPDDPFSTIPSVFTDGIGPPPRSWVYVNDAVKALFTSWGLYASAEQERPAKKSTKMKEYLESVMLSNGMWEASGEAFQDADIHKKVYLAVQKAYRPAFDATIMEVPPGQELERVQDFFKRWISDSMTRAWYSIPDAERILTVHNVSRLFQNMLAPFGHYDKFSTIPSAMTEGISSIPRNWAFVNDEVNALFNSWRGEMVEKKRVKAPKNVWKQPELSVGDSAMLYVRFGKWKGNHSVKILAKEETGWKVHHDEDGYECVVKWADVESGKLAFANENNKFFFKRFNKARVKASKQDTEEAAGEGTSQEPTEEKEAAEEAATGEVAVEKPPQIEAVTVSVAAGQGVAKAKAAGRNASDGKAASAGKAAVEELVAEKPAEEENVAAAGKNPAGAKAAAEKAALKKAAKEKAARPKALAKNARGEKAGVKKAEGEGPVERSVDETADAEERPAADAVEGEAATLVARKPAAGKSAAAKAAAKKLARGNVGAAKKAGRVTASAENAIANEATGTTVAEKAVPKKAALEKRPREQAAISAADSSAKEVTAVDKAAVNKAAVEKSARQKALAKKKASKVKKTPHEMASAEGSGEKLSGQEAVAQKPIGNKEEAGTSAAQKPRDEGAHAGQAAAKNSAKKEAASEEAS